MVIWSSDHADQEIASHVSSFDYKRNKMFPLWKPFMKIGVSYNISVVRMGLMGLTNK